MNIQPPPCTELGGARVFFKPPSPEIAITYKVNIIFYVYIIDVAEVESGFESYCVGIVIVLSH